MMLRHILSFCLMLVLESVATEESTYTLYACDRDPKENGTCNPVTTGATRLHQFGEKISANSSDAKSAISFYKINIWALVPFSENECYPFSRSLVEPALYQAVIDANEMLCSDIFANQASGQKNVCYQITMNDTQCDAITGLLEALAVEEARNLAEKCSDTSSPDIIMERDMFLGMSCDFVASRVSGIAAYWDWPEVLPGIRSSQFDDKQGACVCGTTTRTGHSATDLGRFLYQYYTLGDKPWNSSFIIYNGGSSLHGAPLQFDQITDCQFLLQGVTSTFNANNLGYTIYDTIRSDEDVIENAEKILLDLAGQTRVTLWCIGRKAMRVVMNTAAKLGMTKGADKREAFTFTYIDLYNNNVSYAWSNEPDYPCKDDNMTVGNSTDGMEALQVVTLHRPQTPEFIKFSENMMSKAQIPRPQQFVNHYVTQYYNSMRLIINGVTNVVESDPDILYDGVAFTAQLWNRTFESIDGTVFIDEQGNQHMNYAVMDLNQKTNKFEEVAVFYGCNQTWDQLADIDWPGKDRPSSAPPCDGSYVCVEDVLSSAAIVAIAFSVLLLACLLFISVIARRKVLQESQLREMRWKIKKEDINFNRKLARRLSGVSEATYSTAGSDSIVSSIHGRQMFARTAEWNHQVVAVKDMDSPKKLILDRKFLVELNEMMSLNHEHICKFLGICIEGPIMVITEYCPRGSLQDFLEGDMYGKLDDMFRNSLILDIAKGMLYLHKSPLQTHGNLKSANCLLDGRLVVKLTDFGLSSLKQRHRRDSVIGYNHHKDLLWTAPEHLRSEHTEPFQGTQKGDVYSFAIVVQEILYRMGPFYLGDVEESLNPTDICRRVGVLENVPFRPTLQDDDYVIVGEQMHTMVSLCWEEKPEDRPTFVAIVEIMKKFTKKQNLIDRMIDRLEQYSTNLEDKVEERTIQYRAEKERADNLLYQMLPRPVAEMLKSRREVVPCKYDCVTIYFSDIVGFTSISHKSNAFQVVTMLDGLYTAFDRVVDRYDVYKVETIGDAYMVTSGLPERNSDLHVREIARTALHLLEEARNFKIPHMPEESLKIRVGIHSGPVVTGVVGEKMPRYCLFGDTVNTAARMEQSGEGMRIQLSPKAKSLLENFDTFVVKERETPVHLKGLGTWKTWWLERENVDVDDDSIATLKPTLEPFNANNHLRESKKVSRTSDYGSARSSVIDAQRAVTGIVEDDGRMKMPPTVNVEMSDRSSSIESDSYQGTGHKKRRGTVILMEEAEITSLTSYYERQREKSFGYLPGISKVEFHDGYSSLNLPATSRNKRRGRSSPNPSSLAAYNESEEVSVL